MSSTNELRVVLLGKTGNGKSSLGCTLLAREAFHVECSFKSVTFRCQWAYGFRQNTLLQVTDTPGVSDTDRKEDEVLTEIGKSIAVASPGPHIVLMVLKCGRFTKEEYMAYNTLKKLFGEGIKDFLILVFTGADHLDGNTQDERMECFQEALATAPANLNEVLQDANGRYFIISNIDEKQQRERQADDLTAMMMDLVAKNTNAGHAYFTDQLCEEVNSLVNEQVQRHVLNDHVTEEQAAIDTRVAIVNNDEEPGFFKSLKKAITKTVVPVLAVAAGQVVQVAAKVAVTAIATRCSIM